MSKSVDYVLEVTARICASATCPHGYDLKGALSELDKFDYAMNFANRVNTNSPEFNLIESGQYDHYEGAIEVIYETSGVTDAVGSDGQPLVDYPVYRVETNLEGWLLTCGQFYDAVISYIGVISYSTKIVDVSPVQ